MNVHHAKGDAEITKLKDINPTTDIKTYTDSDLGTDLVTRRSVTSVVHEHNDVVFAWKIIKQGGIAHHTNDAELRAFFTGIKQTKVFRRFLEYLMKMTTLQYIKSKQIN